MGLFTPVYYNEKKSYDERLKAVEEEKSERRLRKLANDAAVDIRFRAVAIRKLQDPSLCEALLMEYAGKDITKWPNDHESYVFQAAAQFLAALGEQSRLERIFRQCRNYGIKSIVIKNIEDTAFLEKAAINQGEEFGPDPWYTKVAQNAVTRITDDSTLARVAIFSFHAYPAEDAAKRVKDEVQLQNIVLKSPYIGARINAAKRVQNTESLLVHLREELTPVITENPMGSYHQAKLLGVCGDPLAKLVLYFTEGQKGVREFDSRFTEKEVLKTDPDILLPLLKSVFQSLSAEKNHADRERISRIAKCLRSMHENGISSRRIEAEFPKTIQYDFQYVEYAGDDYDSGYRTGGTETITLW